MITCTALRLWLLGQLIEMLMIGALSTLAVWLIGLPSPFALGLIAGVTEFVPYVGPIVSAIPAILCPSAWWISVYATTVQMTGLRPCVAATNADEIESFLSVTEHLLAERRALDRVDDVVLPR